MMRHPFVLFALGTFAVFLLLHLAGGRQYVGVLSGTVVGGAGGAGLGLLYALAWFGAVLAAPVLLLAGLLDGALARASRARP
ncbi:hypothetical protein D7Y13_27885 [Corallococcus praedator]|uniref:Uncharacterized protein n=1 Tax=Corallococcus praedator TaxID=2316724 RepID=A0ABX9QBX8_9BACT|nr:MULTISPECIES: hypothetical protein [Corallococcus]RKH18755.1 hypothetical protein D7X74_08670 [Corallococcus sp. CA047B]RKH34728.1 hypothetical protein D7X75_07245 [Corallococcus sp. CA031C]RKH99191.1 hypothetical protein D7Y13_27885 [Corallococcus praedator]